MGPNTETNQHKETVPFLGNDGEGDFAGLSGAPTDRSSANGSHKKHMLAIPNRRSSIDTISSIASSYGVSISAVQSAEHGVQRPADAGHATSAPGQVPSDSLRAWSQHYWLEYKGLLLMVLAQMFGACMSTTARFLQTLDGDIPPMSTFQVLFIRMSVTMVACLGYMWWAKVPHAPFGKKEVRYLLVLRGFAGFFGVFGLYYSVVYLPLAEATVITFLAPLLAAWISSVMLKTPFTRIHKIAGFISMTGVVLIAQPFHFFTSPPESKPESGDAEVTPSRFTLHLLRAVSDGAIDSAKENSGGSSSAHDVTPRQRAVAVGVGLLGVCGAACAYFTITWIGKRAHPLISVNYFAVWCTVVSTGVLLFWPSSTFRLPADWREWLLILFLGCSGFIMQFLLTSALAHDRNRGKVLNVVYTHMLFALVMDKLVWGTTPGALSIVGSSMILGSAIWVAVSKEKPEGKEAARSAAGTVTTATTATAAAPVEAEVVGGQRRLDEEVGLVEDVDDDDNGDDDRLY